MCGGELEVGEQDKRDALLRNQNGLGPEIESWGCCTQWQAVGAGSGRQGRDDMEVHREAAQGVITISGPSISYQGPFCQF